MSYLLVFDARSVRPVTSATIAPLALLALVCVVLLVAGRRGWLYAGREGAHSRGALTLAGAAGLILISIAAFVEVFLKQGQHDRLVEALHTGSYTSVEGVVEDFVPGDAGGHTDESWTVRSGGRRYKYSYRWSMDVPGFHQSAGPIRGGLRVRIADVDGHIARLEIGRKPSDLDL
jgi:hypothetical protein